MNRDRQRLRRATDRTRLGEGDRSSHAARDARQPMAVVGAKLVLVGAVVWAVWKVLEIEVRGR